MIDTSQWRISIGIHYLWAPQRRSFNYDIKGEYHLYNVLVTVWLTTVIRVAFVLMLPLLCGDVESNPGPKGYKVCPSCSEQVPISQVKCNCGYTLKRKIGRPAGTTAEAHLQDILRKLPEKQASRTTLREYTQKLQC